MSRMLHLKNTCKFIKAIRVLNPPSLIVRRMSADQSHRLKPLRISQHLGNQTDRLYTFEDGTTAIKKHKETSANGLVEQYVIKAKAYFLPNGYPASTNAGYGKYVSLQALAYIFASTSSVLSMQCLLYAMGMGENSLPLAATLNWV